MHPAESRAGKGREVRKPRVFAQPCIHCLLHQAQLNIDSANQALSWDRQSQVAGPAEGGSTVCGDKGLGQSHTQLQVLREQTRKKRLREGQRPPKITQHLLNFRKGPLPAPPSLCLRGLEKRKPTGAIPQCAQQKEDTDAITKRRDNWFSDDNSTWLMGREAPVYQVPG